MLIPLLAVHLTRDAGFSGAAAGAVLAVRQVTQQGLMLFAGALADRVGYRPIIAIGLLVRALGFMGFALSDALPVVLLSAVMAALGGALFEATGSTAVVGLLYAVGAGAGLALQYPLVRLASVWLSPIATVAAGIALMGLGLGLMVFAGGAAGTLFMVAAVAVFAAGRALVEPSKDVVTADLAPRDALACYFGVAFLALAVGGSAGNYVGGWLFDVATAKGLDALPWIIFAGAGLAIGAGLLLFARRLTRSGPDREPACLPRHYLQMAEDRWPWDASNADRLCRLPSERREAGIRHVAVGLRGLHLHTVTVATAR